MVIQSNGAQAVEADSVEAGVETSVGESEIPELDAEFFATAVHTAPGEDLIAALHVARASE